MSPLERTSRRRMTASAVIVLALVLVSCGAPGGGTRPPPPPPDDAVADTLDALGVNTTSSPRSGPDGEELGADDAPLGARASFSAEEADGARPTMELVMARDSETADTFVVEEIVGAQVTTKGVVEYGTESVLKDLSEGNEVWTTPILPHDNYYQSLRDVAAGDLDGDGFDETAALYFDTDDGDLKVRVFEDAAQDFTVSSSTLTDGTDIESLKLIAVDRDGDGIEDLIAALAYDDRVELMALTEANGSYSLGTDAVATLPQLVEASMLYVRLAAGQLDYDNGNELVVVVDEISGAYTGLANYYVYDDAVAGGVELDSGPVQAVSGALRVAQAADVVVADVDGDGLDEVILGGPEVLADFCDDSFYTILFALDDAVGAFASLGSWYGEPFYNNCHSYASWKRLFVFLTAPDLDGDGVHELTANQIVFDDFLDAAPFTPLAGVALPASEFLDDNHDDSQPLSVSTTAVLAADVTGDGRDDLMVYHQNRAEMKVWGLSAVTIVGDDGWTQLSSIATPGFHNGQESARPLLVAANVDTDGPVLRYGKGSHELVFTEPIVIAALAAPPCNDAIDQNVGACVTQFGEGASTGTDASLSVTVTASASVGVDTTVNVPFAGDIGVKTKRTVALTASTWAGTAYTVSKTITYSSGPLEDAVVFTSIPYDVYRYEILSHPDPTFVGKLVVVRLPREPVTIIAELGFFNDAVPEADDRIGTEVFTHTPGDLSSYPSENEKDVLLGQHDGLEFGPSGVGQGTGSTQLQIQVSSQVSAGGSLGIEFSRSIEATAGVAIAEFSVGYGAEASLTLTSGAQTTYTGTVGSISAADHVANAYEWGIFTYVQEQGGRRFEVINYWVE